MNFEDATDPSFLERLKTFEGPGNGTSIVLYRPLAIPGITDNERHTIAEMTKEVLRNG